MGILKLSEALDSNFEATLQMRELEMIQQNLIAEFNYTKWLPAGMQGIKENKGNCRNCGANSYKNNKCNYCGTNN